MDRNHELREMARTRLLARQRVRVMTRWGKQAGLINPNEADDLALLQGDTPELELDDLELTRTEEPAA